MEWQNVSVFVSSTFNDMHAERDLLVKRVFPELAQWCARRRLRLYDIDLRWGVTEEDSRNSRTVGVCLRGVDDNPPLFLCFIGQRRGWIPGRDEVDDATLTEYDGLSERLGKRSATELEIEHALLDPMVRMVEGQPTERAMRERALFFVRDGSYVATLDAAQRLVYTNDGAQDPVEADRMHAQFARRVRGACDAVFDYDCTFDPSIHSPELEPEAARRGPSCAEGRLTDFAVGDVPLERFVLEAMKGRILEAFPGREEALDEPTASPGALEEVLQAQRLDERKRDTIERPEVSRALRAYCAHPDGKPLYVCGAAGSGKSSLLAHFFEGERASYPHAYLRFCGATTESGTWAAIWRGLDRAAGGEGLFADDEVSRRLPDVLSRLAAGGGALVIIDGVDELVEGVSALATLPPELPEGMRLIVSFRTSASRAGAPSAQEGDTSQADAALEHARSTGSAHTYVVEPFGDAGEVKGLAETYLSHYLKTLDDAQLRALCDNRSAHNPLFLKILLSELRIFGSFEQMNDQMAAYGDAPNTAFGKLLADLEAEIAYAPIEPATFVPRLVGLLARARGMLGMADLRDALASLLGCPDEDIADATAYYLRRLRPYLYADGVRVGIAYQTLREAATRRYASGARDEHLALAQALQDGAPVECLYHLRCAGEAERIGQLTADLPFVCRAIATSGAFAVSAELAACGTAANADLAACLAQIAPVTGSDAGVAAALLYKELPAPLRDQAAALCPVPWLRYEPIELEPYREESAEAPQVVFSVEHHVNGFALARDARRAFLLQGACEVLACDVATGEQTASFTLPDVDRARALCCSDGGLVLACATERNEVRIYRVTLSEEGRLLGCTLVKADACASVRFGGPCLFGCGDGIVWQRPNGEVCRLREGERDERVLCSRQERLAGWSDPCSVWRSGRQWMLCVPQADGQEQELRFDLRVNDCIKEADRLCVAVEDRTLFVWDRASGGLSAQPDRSVALPEAIASLAMHEGALYGVDRWGGLMRMTSDCQVSALGRLTIGDDALDTNTRLASLGADGLCYLSSIRRALLRSAQGASASRIMRVAPSGEGQSVLWGGRETFCAMLASGRRLVVPYPSWLREGTNVNQLNNLKAACAPDAVAYESDEPGVIVVESGTGRCRVPSQDGWNLVDLQYAPDCGEFQAVTHGGQLIAISTRGDMTARTELSRSTSGVYLLCACGSRVAVLSRRVQVRVGGSHSAVMEDVVTMVAGGAVAWTKRLSVLSAGDDGTPLCMAYDQVRDELALCFGRSLCIYDAATGSRRTDHALTSTRYAYQYGEAVLDGALYRQGMGEGGVPALESVAMAGGARVSLPTHRRLTGIVPADGCVLVREDNDRLYRVYLQDVPLGTSRGCG